MYFRLRDPHLLGLPRQDLEIICIMGLAQPALSTTGKPLIRLLLSQLESALWKLSRASQPVFPTRMRMNGRTILWRIQGLRNRRCECRVASTYPWVLPTIRMLWLLLSRIQARPLTLPMPHDPTSCAQRKYIVQQLPLLLVLELFAPTTLCPVESPPPSPLLHFL